MGKRWRWRGVREDIVTVREIDMRAHTGSSIRMVASTTYNAAADTNEIEAGSGVKFLSARGMATFRMGVHEERT